MVPDNQHLIPGGIPGDLRGAKGRVVTGGAIIFFGLVNIILPIAMLVSSSGQHYLAGEGIGFLQILAGIGFIVLSIVAGCLGIFGRKSNCMIVTYLVLCVVLAIFTGCVGVWTSLLTIVVAAEQEIQLYRYDLTSLYALLLVNSLTNALHCLVAIVGACFTCGAVCCIPDTRDTEQRMLVMPIPGAMQIQQQLGTNAYNVGPTHVPINGNVPVYSPLAMGKAAV